MSDAKFLPKVIEYDRYQPEFYEDTFTYIKKRSSVVLQPENEDYEPIELNGKSEAQIWGVVTSVIHDL